MDYRQISKDFAQRTKAIIEQYSGEYEVTLLVNCCLGLLVVPKEIDIDKIPDETIPENGEFWGLSRDSVTVKCSECGYKLRDVIRRIRNGICHFNITSIPDDKRQIQFLEIKDRKDFVAKLSVDQLRTLVVSLTERVYGPY